MSTSNEGLKVCVDVDYHGESKQFVVATFEGVTDPDVYPIRQLVNQLKKSGWYAPPDHELPVHCRIHTVYVIKYINQPTPEPLP